MQTISLPVEVYQGLINQVKLLNQNELLMKVNELIDTIYQNKYGLYLVDYTEDLTEYSLQTIAEQSGECWDEL